MPPAARVSDPHACPVVEQGNPHVGGPILPEGDPTVLIGFMPAARQGDGVFCKGATDAVAAGSPTVLIGHKQAARLGESDDPRRGRGRWLPQRQDRRLGAGRRAPNRQGLRRAV